MKTSCTCTKCISRCQANPGWMSPEDAEAAIEAGLAQQLMRDWLEPCGELNNDERVFILCPASLGSAGLDAPEAESVTEYFMGWTKGRCVFLAGGWCQLHATSFKPKQCKETFGCAPVGPSNYDMAKLWDTPKAQALVERWQELVRQKVA